MMDYTAVLEHYVSSINLSLLLVICKFVYSFVNWYLVLCKESKVLVLLHCAFD